MLTVVSPRKSAREAFARRRAGVVHEEMGIKAVASPPPVPARLMSGEQVRLRLRQLDACLERLEGAHERGVTTVPDPLATAIRRYVPALAPGMAITHAIELVMREQEPYLASAVAARSSSPRWSGMQEGSSRTAAGRDSVEVSTERTDAGTPAVAIDENGARDLTERIRAAAHNAHRLCSLLVEAHDRRAWSAIGYATWSDYIRSEFQLSRSRSYELLDHGRVLRALVSATGLSGIPDISAYAASQIKPHLPEVVEAIRARTAGLPQESIARVAEQVVWEVRSRHAGARRGVPRAHDGRDLARLFEAVRTLADMPDVSVMLSAITRSDGQHLEGLSEALRWLTDFARAWRDGGQETTGTLEAAS